MSSLDTRAVESGNVSHYGFGFRTRDSMSGEMLALVARPVLGDGIRQPLISRANRFAH